MIFQSLWFLWWFPLLLTRKLLNNGFLLVKSKSLLRKFYRRHHDLVGRYGISVSQMTTNLFRFSILSSLILVCKKINMMGTTSWAGIAYPSEQLSSLPDLCGVHATRSLVRCLYFCSFSFTHCVVCFFRHTDYDYPFGIFKLFLNNIEQICLGLN